jgi:hypothetical protein
MPTGAYNSSSMSRRKALRKSCNYHEAAPPVANAKPVVGRMKVAARRYLPEFPDNYLARNDLAINAASAVKRLLK